MITDRKAGEPRMNINEVEKLTGLAKANIRYYESEGLLDPPRLANGYRDYSGDHVLLLKKIRLLRMLDMPIEEIRSVVRGETVLAEELTRQLHRLQEKQAEAEESEAICRRMLQDGVDFALFDPEQYLDTSLGSLQKEHIVLKLEQDREPRLSIPWQRYFARVFDMGIYTLIWYAAASLGLRYRIYTLSTGNNIVTAIVTALLMLLIEPFLLHFFGTTPGKWLLGMRIEGRHGRKPDLSCAYARTSQAVFYGLGLGIPFFSLYRLYKSYKTEQAGEDLSWEGETEIVYRSRSWKGVLSYVFCTFLVLFLALCACAEAELPVHRGDLTVQQLAENYRHYRRYLSVPVQFDLNDDGQFYDFANSNDLFYSESKTCPVLDCQIEDGYIRSLTMTNSRSGKTLTTQASFSPEMALLAYSYVLAQEDAGLFRAGLIRKEQDRVMRQITEHSFESWDEDLYGVHLDLDVSYTGLTDLGFYLWKTDEDQDRETDFKLTFTMTQTY